MYFYTLLSDVAAAAGGYFALLFQNALIQVMLNPFLRWEKAEKANGEKEKE